MRLIHEDTETLVDMGGNHGDYDLGREFSKRFTWEGDDGKFRTITYSYWVEARDSEGNEVQAGQDEEDLLANLKVWEAERAAKSREIQDRSRAGEHLWLTEELRKWEDENPRPIRYHWCESGESGIHDELDEVEADDVEYGDGSVFFYDTKEQAEEAAKVECDHLKPEHFNPEYI